jgi:hypothetical protein
MIGASGATGATGAQGPAGGTQLELSEPLPFCVAGGGSVMAYSSDGLTWTASTQNPYSNGGSINAIANNGTKWISVGSTTCSSTNGVNWTALSSQPNLSEGYCVAWNGSYWLVGGNYGIFKSTDGVTWTSSTSVINAVLGLKWNGSIWVAVGGGDNKVAYSSDGINWTPSASGNIVFSAGATAIQYNGSIWVAGASNPNSGHTLGYSYDGIAWTPCPNSLDALNFRVAVIGWNGSMWVAGGSYSLAYSIDGINWTHSDQAVVTDTVFGLDWNGSVWVAGGYGQNQMMYSTDGMDWQLSEGNSLFTGAIRAISSKKIFASYFPTIATTALYFQSGTSVEVFQSTITTSTVSTFTSTFMYTGAAETFAIPEGTTQITFDVLGAGGANLGGGGAYVSGTYTVQSGDVGFSVYVGQGGQLTGNSLGAQLVGTSFLLQQSGGSAALTTDPTSVGGGGGGASGILFPDGSKIVAGAGAGGYVYGSTLHRGGAGGLLYGSEPQQTNEA